jgi:hypothetical protein
VPQLLDVGVISGTELVEDADDLLYAVAEETLSFRP